MESITSYYSLSIENSWVGIDSHQEWLNFCKSTVEYWKKFVNKWIISNENPNTFYLPYSAFIKDPQEKLKEIIAFIDPSEGLDTKKISEIVAKQDIRQRHAVHDFKYYNESFFKEIEDGVSKELELLKITTYF